MAQTNVGTAAYATSFGIPSGNCSWIGRTGGAGTPRVGTIYNAIEIASESDVSQTTDNSGEIQAVRGRNDRVKYTLAIKPTAASAAAALVIAGDLPKIPSILTLTSDASVTDVSASGTIIIESATASFTPDGEAIVNITATKHIGKTFSALS